MAISIRRNGSAPKITFVIGYAQQGLYESKVRLANGLKRLVGEGASDDDITDTHVIGAPDELHNALVSWVIFSDSASSDPGALHGATVRITQDGQLLHEKVYGSDATRPYVGVVKLVVPS